MNFSTRVFTTAAIALASLSASVSMAQVKVEKDVSYLGSPHNIRLSNGTVDLMLASDYGPRIMRYAFIGSGENGNIFATIPGITLHTDLGDWYIRGGARVWHSPEAIPRSYVPDNGPIDVEQQGETFRMIQPTEKPTGIQKEIDVTLAPEGSHVTVVFKLTNHSMFPVQMAVWAMSAMNKNGKAIFPQEPHVPHSVDISPARTLTLWKFTDMSDPRWMWGRQFITLTQDPHRERAQKIGIQDKQNWAAYYRDGDLMLKRIQRHPDAVYPDEGSNVESFTNNVFLELETLGPIENVQPGETISHTEQWWLFKNVDLGQGEAGIAAAMQPILNETMPAK